MHPILSVLDHLQRHEKVNEVVIFLIPDHDRKAEVPCKVYDRLAKLEAGVRRMNGENRLTGFVSPGKSVEINQQK
jgi:hypothetical protein